VEGQRTLTQPETGTIEDKPMRTPQVVAVLTLTVLGIVVPASANNEDETTTAGDALVIRLVHPDRQAAELLKLFTGARAAHPAAALAAWKRSARDPNQLGKPLEAVIATFNPEMAREWKVLHEVELRLGFGANDGKARWYAVVPHDDGTLSAAVTALRITDGAAEHPVSMAGREIAVERLGPTGGVESARFVETLLFGGSRDDLVRGLRRIGADLRYMPADTSRAGAQPNSAVPGSEHGVDSGLLFELDTHRLPVNVGPTLVRRFATLLQGIGCRQIDGHAAFKDDLLALEATTRLAQKEPSSPSRAAPPAGVDRSWLTWVPARDAMGVISLAFEPGAGFWDSAFALADRVERADPSRGDIAPLRTRFNLLATAAGTRPEVDLWPHLKGVTASVSADSHQPGRPSGGLIVLHTDTDASAERLATDVLPRLSGLLTGKKPPREKARKEQLGEDLPAQPARDAQARGVIELGMVSGRPLLVFWRGRDVVIAWGGDALSASIEAAATPDRSVAPLCADWAVHGKTAPQRLGAVWPARCLPALRRSDTTTPLWQVLHQDPPAVWWGWTEPDKAQDTIHFSGLRQRVHQFLDKLPLDPSPIQ
jgi:hypothetical protein